MEQPSQNLMIVAGEASGDLHGAHLVEAIRAKAPHIKFYGLGGPQMKARGVEIFEDLTQMAVVGFVEVLKHLGDIKRIFDLFLQKVDEVKPAAVILVDYPGFNLRMARALKARHIKVIYYISPQVWAWKENRIEQIKQNTDKMLVLFKFEKELYAKHGLDVFFVGHPLIDTVRVKISKDDLLESIGFSPSKFTIGLLPGSREKEITSLLPPMIKAAKILYHDHRNLQFLLMKAPTIRMSFLKEHLGDHSLPLKIIPDRTYDGVNASDACLVASGTATLENAILNKPMVVVYKTSTLTWALAKSFIKIPYIGLVNVVAGKKIVPECIQFNATGRIIADTLRTIIDDDKKMAEMKTELTKVKLSLGQPGANERAALRILDLIGENRQ